MSFLPMALGGLALGDACSAARPGRRRATSSPAVLLVLSVAAYALGRGTTGRVDRVLRHDRRGRRRHVPGHGHGRRELSSPWTCCRRFGAGGVLAAAAVDRPAGPDRLHAADPVPRRDPARRRPAPSTTRGSSSVVDHARRRRRVLGCSSAGSAPARSSGSSTGSDPASRPQGRHEATSADGAGRRLRRATASASASASRGPRLGSVREVAGAGEVHRDAGRLGRLDDLVVADRATGRDDRAHPGVEQDLQPVGEREERVGRRDRAARALLTRARRRRGGRSRPG